MDLTGKIQQTDMISNSSYNLYQIPTETRLFATRKGKYGIKSRRIDRLIWATFALSVLQVFAPTPAFADTLLPAYLAGAAVRVDPNSPITLSHMGSAVLAYDVATQLNWDQGLGVMTTLTTSSVAQAAVSGSPLSTNVTLDPSNAPFVYGESESEGGHYAGADSAMYYYFRANSSVDKLILVDLSYMAQRAVGFIDNGTIIYSDIFGYSYYSSYVVAASDSTAPIAGSVVESICGAPYTSCLGIDGKVESWTNVIQLRTNTLYEILMRSNTRSVNYTESGTGTFESFSSVYLDPYITIDPSTDANDISLQFSPGVTNLPPASAVPEPANWALVLSGFGLVVFALRRQAKMTVCVACN